MKHDTLLHAPPYVSHINSVGHLSYPSECELDPSPLRVLLAEKGEYEAEEIICRVLEDIAFRLDLLQIVMADHQFDEIRKQVRRIHHVSKGLGLLDVCSIALSAAQAAAQHDGVAIHAVVARLERAFELAVCEIWRYRHP